MKILHVAYTVAGGLASYLEEICRFQTAVLGSDNVHFLVPAHNRSHMPTISAEQITEFAPAGQPLSRLTAFAFASRREIIGYKPDIVHLHSTFAGAIVRPIARLPFSRAKVIYCPHGWAFGMEVPFWRKVVYALIERSLCVLTDKIINISFFEEREALHWGIPASKMVVIRNGVAEEGASIPTYSNPLPNDKINLLFAGRHDQQKGLDILLQAFRDSQPSCAHLHIVGAPVVDATCSATEATDQGVTYYGWLRREEVFGLMRAADALVMPSRWEGFGLAAVEAMRLGKAVLASRRGGLAEVVEDGRTGLLFDVSSSEELKKLLKHLDRAQLLEFGQAGQQRFKALFTAERMNAELIGVYRSVYRGRVPSRPWRRQAGKQPVEDF
jgi:glycosyltransferase involved in cell wall biosynthesis